MTSRASAYTFTALDGIRSRRFESVGDRPCTTAPEGVDAIPSGKGLGQIRDVPDSYVVNDDVEVGIGNKIPLWLFGFLY